MPFDFFNINVFKRNYRCTMNGLCLRLQFEILISRLLSGKAFVCITVTTFINLGESMTRLNGEKSFQVAEWCKDKAWRKWRGSLGKEFLIKTRIAPAPPLMGSLDSSFNWLPTLV